MIVVGQVTSPRSQVEKNALKPSTTWVETDLVIVSDLQLWGGINGWGLRRLASGSPILVLLDAFYEIPHSFLEYGTGVIGWRETWLRESMIGWNVVVLSPVGSLHWLMRNYFHWFSCVNVLVYIWIFMVDMFIVFMFLLCCLCVHFMATTMFVSEHVFTCIWMDIVSMT